jgi:N-acetylmuramoyl-L-alanine amidase
MKLRVFGLVLGVLGSISCSTHRQFTDIKIPRDLPISEVVIDRRFEIPVEGERVRLTKQYLRLHNPSLFEDLPTADSAGSISFKPRMIVIHFTAIPTLEATMNYFGSSRIDGDREKIRRNGDLNVGVQFVIDRDGTIYSLYPETIMARHVIGLNHVAIGIENVGNGDLGDSSARYPLTADQLSANVTLVRYLKGRYADLEFLIGHQEYRDVEHKSHPAHNLFYEEFPEYRTEKSDPGGRFMRQLRMKLRAAAIQFPNR